MKNNSRPAEGENRRESEITPRPKPSRLQVYRSWCKKCGICVAFCPKGALETDPEGFPRWKSPIVCVACRMCELRCPDFAIEVIMDQGQSDA
jgi:2-oxoglutarate ferredoxin oxidoreductase subunit delta